MLDSITKAWSSLYLSTFHQELLNRYEGVSWDMSTMKPALLRRQGLLICVSVVQHNWISLRMGMCSEQNVCFNVQLHFHRVSGNRMCWNNHALKGMFFDVWWSLCILWLIEANLHDISCNMVSVQNRPVGYDSSVPCTIQFVWYKGLDLGCCLEKTRLCIGI